jgi:endonuclease-3
MPKAPTDGPRPTTAERGKARAVLNRLKRRYPEIGTALDYLDPWQLLVATVLSAQTTDDNVNRVTPVLFERYPTAYELAEADPEEVERIVYSTGYYRQKTKSIIAMATAVRDDLGGVVPPDLEGLIKLPGVGRKTASVVMVEAFKAPAIAVDTHVQRVTRRLGLTASTDPANIEADLRALYPIGQWQGLSMRFIQFGRDVCDARRPRCGSCELYKLCHWPDRAFWRGVMGPGPHNSAPKRKGTRSGV